MILLIYESSVHNGLAVTGAKFIFEDIQFSDDEGNKDDRDASDEDSHPSKKKSRHNTGAAVDKKIEQVRSAPPLNHLAPQSSYA